VSRGDEGMTQHMPWLLFVWVFANQSGVPVPVAPWLLTAGALARGGQVSVAAIVAYAVAAALGADLIYYSLGRLWGTSRLAAACFRVMRLPSASFNRAARALRAHHTGFMWSARFLPELNPVAAGLAGAAGMPLVHFLGRAVVSAVGWAGAWTGLGYLLGRMVLEHDASFRIAWTVMVAVAVAAAAGSILIMLTVRRRLGPPVVTAAARFARTSCLERYRIQTLGGVDTSRSRLSRERRGSVRGQSGESASAA
jgi:membrane protein DedA with SNARE-associated domain